MDVLELFFTRYSNKRKRQREDELNSRSAFLEDEIKSVQLFFRLLYNQRKVAFHKSSGLGSVTRNIIFLPQRISFFESKELNRKLYLHKALVAAVILKNEIRYIKTWEQKKLRSFQIWSVQEVIKSQLREEIHSYDDFFSDIFGKIAEGSYRKERNDIVFNHWVSAIQPVNADYNNKSLDKEIENLYSILSDLHSKRINYYPLSELMLYCGLMAPFDRNEGDSIGESNFQRSIGETEVEGESVSSVDVNHIDLDKKKDQENPILHSFETLHTADEYQGGYRVSDATDDMADHQNALDELNLESVTRSGEQAKSIYRAFIDGLLEISDASESKVKKYKYKKYPEWDYKLGQLKKGHCRIYFPEKLDSKQSEVAAEWLSSLKENYKFDIKKWKKKIEFIVNTETWVNRQWSGQEIDIESFVDFYVDSVRGQAQECPLYINYKRNTLDAYCMLLFDQSFSTDSWVQNRRVLDVELEAIGLTGLLTSTFLKNVAVAGTWSETRNHCYFNLCKDYSEDWSSFFNRVTQIAPQGYTRLGPAIRHATESLCSMGAKRRLLIVLTDGKPTDYDRYEGRYGVEDIRHAILKAEKDGVFVRSLAIEKRHAAHLQQMFGYNKYTILNDVKKFPESLLKIYLESIYS